MPTGPDSPSLEFKELLKNEKSNFKLVNSAVSFLGGVPAMINPADMSNTIPNEKVRPGGRCVINSLQEHRALFLVKFITTDY